MTPSVTVSTSAPNIVAESILLELQSSENEANEHLIEILGLIKPSRSSASSISSIVRGLFTKNSKLLALLFAKLQGIKNRETDVKEAYKSFVNDFVLWMDNDGIILFEKYSNLISIGDENINLNKNAFSRPIINLKNYINFIDKSVGILRNPFVLEKLHNVKVRLVDIVNSFDNTNNTKELNEFSFDNIQIFGSNVNNGKQRKSSKHQDKVSSFFHIDQIVDRTFNEDIFLSGENIPVELVLLNVTNNPSNRFNALAIISIDCKVRSLMYPPFRVNELSMYSKGDTIILKSIDFLVSGTNDAKITLKFKNNEVLERWTQHLLTIFPFQEENSPVSDTFLISSEVEPPKMSGLGIDYFSDSERKQSIDSSNNVHMPKPQFKEVYSPDSISSDESPISQLIKNSKSSAVDDFKDMAPPQFINTRRKFSNSSIGSSVSIESCGSQHNERSLQVINKALSNGSSKFKAIEVEDGNHVKEIKRSTLSLSSSESDFQQRPISSHAEIQGLGAPNSFKLDHNINESKTSIVEYAPMVDNRFASVPNLSESKQDNKMYQLSTGSAIDISNFGKNHQPSFLSDDTLVNNGSSNGKKKSLFSIFKKSSKPKDKSVDGFQMVERPALNLSDHQIKTVEESVEPVQQPKKNDINKKKLEINTNIKPETIEDGPYSAMSENNDESVAKPSTIPAAFALPSSTSMYFFKPFANASTASLTQSNNDSQTNLNIPEEDLKIPQDLKDIINNDESIDFYLSNNSPKTMIISKWKEKYGKWEMITTSEKIFAKIVVNYILNKSWLIFFKEEYDQTYDEEIDKPILLLDIVNNQTTARQSALDLQISAINSITSEKMNIMVRCKSGSLAGSIKESVENVLGVLNGKGNESLRNSKQTYSDSTITSSIMDSRDKPSNSSTLTSLNTISNSPYNSKSAKEVNEQKSTSLSSERLTSHTVLNNPENSRLIVLYSMTVRLQKQLEAYEKKNIPSSWKILSMYSLSIFVISDNFTNKNYYNLVLESHENQGSDEAFNWLISEDDKYTKLERIGRAGLLVKMSDSDIFMIECRGKKELKQLFEKFAL
ncbi:hypothetical protein DFJ63DRAFT_312077 [Scheffersomyces coipomensis]|uniref:uncharacterized protein n=1 Tax=Scheffersomyces coipomensis TaxID=1788519 RepID=UPI00315DFD51